MRLGLFHPLCTAALVAAMCLTFAHNAQASEHPQSPPPWALQLLQTPVPSLTDDPPAVILSDEYVETIDAQGRATEREREAIRILKPQGRGTVCAVGYDVDEKLIYFRGWTVTAGGKHFQAQDSDFVEVGYIAIPIELSTEKERVLHPPAADVGATVFCESEELLAPYDQQKVWNIQGDLPFASEALELDLPPGRNYVANWHRYASVAPTQVAPDRWRWELRRVPALNLDDVPSAPSRAALAARMSVTWGNAAVPGKTNQWRAFGEYEAQLQEHRADPTPEIAAQAQTLVDGAPDFYAKLKSITEYIQKNIQYFIVERGIGGWQSHFAGEIFRNRYGDCKDKTALLISMLQAVGIKAYYVLTDDRRGVVDPNDPSFYGNHMITAIAIPAAVNDPRLMAVVKVPGGARLLLFDPTNEKVPVGTLPAYEQGGYGILADGDASQVIAFPVLPPAANGEERSGEFTLAADGSLTGTIQISSIGAAGADTRLVLKYSDPTEQRTALENAVAKDLPGMTLVSYKFTQPPDLDKPLLLTYKVTVPQFAHTAGPLLLVRPRPIGDDTLSFDDKPRAVPINLNATGSWHDSFAITLPPGYIVDELSSPVSVNTDFASYHSTTTVKGNVLHYDREYIVRKVELPASRAGDFRRFEDAIVEDQMEFAVLKKQSAMSKAGL